MVDLSSRPERRILVADDNPVIMQLVVAVVRKEGYEAVTADDGREAYHILQRDANFAAAIFDMMMPHMQGLDLIRYMAKEERLKRIPVVMMTAEPGTEVYTDSFAAGALFFLPKPFTPAQLQIVLRMLVKGKAA